MPPGRGLSCASAPGAARAVSSASAARMRRAFAVVIDRAPLSVLAETAPQARVGDVSNRITEEIQPEYGEADGESGKEYHPGRSLQRLYSRCEHPAPRGLVRGRPGPDEAQRRLHHDGVGDIGGDEHDVGGEAVRDEMAADDAPPRGADGPGGFHVR